MRLTTFAVLVTAIAGCGGPTAAPPETRSPGQRSQEASAVSWGRFRGPNGSGVADDAGPLPTRFDPDTNVVWTTPLPPGHSSPVISGSDLVLTAVEAERLLTIGLDRATGRERWRSAVSAPRREALDTRNHAAAATPAVDPDGHVYVFFGDFGLVSYDADGHERWRVPLGPFTNVYGMGASPIVEDGLVILACDQQQGSFLLALDATTGAERWRTQRPEAKSGHSSPVLWTAADGTRQVLMAGSFMLSAYDLATGDRQWWVGGLPFEMKATPVLDGDTLFVQGYASPFNQVGEQFEIDGWDETVAEHDRDGDGLISRDEFPQAQARGYILYLDLDGDGAMNEEDWRYYRAAMASVNGMVAMRLGGSGEMTAESLVWRYDRAVPQLPSPLLYQGLLYMINDGGILTVFRPATGEIVDRRRLRGGVDDYYASPVAADGKLFFVGTSGKVVVVDAETDGTPGGSLDRVTVNDLRSLAYATPAIAESRIYIRTVDALWAFGE
ncbi:MAG: PQQ-binding-like beta-propeller repeat protein [bacterium]